MPDSTDSYHKGHPSPAGAPVLVTPSGQLDVIDAILAGVVAILAVIALAL